MVKRRSPEAADHKGNSNGPDPFDPDPAELYEIEHPGSRIGDEIRRMEMREAARQIVAQRRWDRIFDPPEDVPSLTAELAVKEQQLIWSVEQLHVRGGNTTIVAEWKSGKTTLLVNLVRSLADGEPFLGRFKVDPPEGNVAIWNYELSRLHFRTWLTEIEINDTDRVVPLTLRGVRLPLLSPLGEKWAVEWLKSHEITTWIIDPYGRAYGGSENDNTMIDEFVEALDYIKAQAGVEDLFMSVHTGRGDKERARGGSRIDDWPDHLWVMTKDGRDRNFGAYGRDVDVESGTLSYDEVTRQLSLTGMTREDQRALRHAHYAVDALRSGEELNNRVLRERMKGDSTYKASGIALAVKNEWIDRQPVGNSHRYRLLKPPRQTKIRVR